MHHQLILVTLCVFACQPQPNTKLDPVPTQTTPTAVAPLVRANELKDETIKGAALVASPTTLPQLPTKPDPSWKLLIDPKSDLSKNKAGLSAYHDDDNPAYHVGKTEAAQVIRAVCGKDWRERCGRELEHGGDVVNAPEVIGKIKGSFTAPKQNETLYLFRVDCFSCSGVSLAIRTKGRFLYNDYISSDSVLLIDPNADGVQELLVVNNNQSNTIATIFSVQGNEIIQDEENFFALFSTDYHPWPLPTALDPDVTKVQDTASWTVVYYEEGPTPVFHLITTTKPI